MWGISFLSCCYLAGLFQTPPVLHEILMSGLKQSLSQQSVFFSCHMTNKRYEIWHVLQTTPNGHTEVYLWAWHLIWPLHMTGLGQERWEWERKCQSVERGQSSRIQRSALHWRGNVRLKMGKKKMRWWEERQRESEWVNEWVAESNCVTVNDGERMWSERRRKQDSVNSTMNWNLNSALFLCKKINDEIFL